MHHKPLTIAQIDGLVERVLIPRAIRKFSVHLDRLPEDVAHYIVTGTLRRAVRRKAWNLRAALYWFDTQLVGYIARTG